MSTPDPGQIFTTPQRVLADLGHAHGWQGDRHLRLLADMTGDGRPDIVAFGQDGIRVLVNNGNGTFDAHVTVHTDGFRPAAFGPAYGWVRGRAHRIPATFSGGGRADILAFKYGEHSSLLKSSGLVDGELRLQLHTLYETDETDISITGEWHATDYPVFAVDLTGDGTPDLGGYGDLGVWTALGDGHGGLSVTPRWVLREFGTRYGFSDSYPRLFADTTGNGCADVVVFSSYGLLVALNNGDGTFATHQNVNPALTSKNGFHHSRNPLLAADLTGDGRADVVAFGDDGVWVQLGNGDGTFGPMLHSLESFSTRDGWGTTWDHPRLLADLTGDGRLDIVGFGQAGVWVALGTGDGYFRTPHLVLDDFGADAGWVTDWHPRFVTDLTGDGRADIIGFGEDGVRVALNVGGGAFAAPPARPVTRTRPRTIDADLTGDGRPDIVGFGERGVLVALNNGDGTFATPRIATRELGNSRGRWRIDRHPRLLTDLTGDGRGDIIAFGDDGVWTALGDGDGGFAAAHRVLDDFGARTGWRTTHPRLVGDLTGDGRADIVGFGEDGVWVARNTGDGTFGAPATVLAGHFGRTGRWHTDRHPRLLTDLTGNGHADIIGFGGRGVRVALGNGDGTFAEPQIVLNQFSTQSGWRANHRRHVVDLTGNGHADLVGFHERGVWTALGEGDGTFSWPQMVLEHFGTQQGWRADRHPRLLADLTGNGHHDVVGFGDHGVWVATGNGDGTFAEPRLVLAEFGHAHGWRTTRHPRTPADLTGDGRADLVGFGSGGVWVADNTGAATFAPPRRVVDGFGLRTGWRTDRHLRFPAPT